MKRAIVTYAEGAHEELLDVALPTYNLFAKKHDYTLLIGQKQGNLLPAWNKIPLVIRALEYYDEVVWFDCDLVVVNVNEDFPKLDRFHSLVRHYEDGSEVPNSGVWRVTKPCIPLLEDILGLQVFRNHGWWEQAALMTLMGYSVPPEGSDFSKTKCRCVNPGIWYESCQFMRLKWNSHPNYRANNPHIVHCSYPDMAQRLEVMRALVRNPEFNYPPYNTVCEYCLKPMKADSDES